VSCQDSQKAKLELWQLGKCFGECDLTQQRNLGEACSTPITQIIQQEDLGEYGEYHSTQKKSLGECDLAQKKNLGKCDLIQKKKLGEACLTLITQRIQKENPGEYC
jgi:hypothetical protein